MMAKYIQVATIMTLVLNLNAQDRPSDTEACSNHTMISDRTRLFHHTQTLNNCDSNLAAGWYKFELDGNAAQIPTTCLKNGLCGTQLPMHLELGVQSLPEPNSTAVWAHVCTSFNILDKWDCCVLRQEVGIRNCGDFYVYHLSPTDRCFVGYCVQEADRPPSKEYIVKTGELVEDITTTQTNETTDLVNTTLSPATTETQSRGSPQLPIRTATESAAVTILCPQSPDFPCYDDNRTCYNDSTVGLLIQCNDSSGCAVPCDNIPTCNDESDETFCHHVTCTEGMRQCPDESGCYSQCDGTTECDDGSDEADCAEDEGMETMGTEYHSRDETSVTTTSIPLNSSSFIDSNTSVTSFVRVQSSFLGTSTLTFTQSSFDSYTSTPLPPPSPTTMRSTTGATGLSAVTTPISSLLDIESSAPSFQLYESGLQFASTPLLSSTIFSSVNFNAESDTQVKHSYVTQATTVDDSSLSSDLQPLFISASSSFPSITEEISRTEPVIFFPSSIFEKPSQDALLYSSPMTSMASSVNSITQSPSVESNESATADNATVQIVRGPITLTFDIIGTAYRNAETIFQEPTFEELLQEAIAGVLNEYSNRDRRDVQNFTKDHVQLLHTEFDEDNATVSVSVTSTKDGEDYIPASELETVLRNQSAIDTLCSALFGDPAFLHNTSIPVSSWSDTSYITSTPVSPSYSASMDDLPQQPSSVYSSLLPDATSSVFPTTESLPVTSASFNTKSDFLTGELTHTTTESNFEYDTEVSLSPSLTQSTIEYTPPQREMNFSSTADTSTFPVLYPSSSIIPTDTPMSESPAFQYSHTGIITEIPLSSTIESVSPIVSYVLSTEAYITPTTVMTATTRVLPENATHLSSFLSETPSSVMDVKYVDLSAEDKSKLQTVSLELSSASVTEQTTQRRTFSNSLQSSPSASSAFLEVTQTLPSKTHVLTDFHTPSSSDAINVVSTSILSRTEFSTITPVISLSATDSHSVISSDEQSTEAIIKESTSEVEASKTTGVYNPQTETSGATLSVTQSSSSLSSSTTVSHLPSRTESKYIFSTESDSRSTEGSTKSVPLEVFTVFPTTKVNLTMEKPATAEELSLFEENFGLFIFLIVASICIVGACIFVLVATLYKRRRHTWDPRLAYQDAYADMEKANLSFHRDVLGIDSPIPDVDILKGELGEQETSLSKASTLTLPRTPRNEEASQTDLTEEPGPSYESEKIISSESTSSSRDNITTPTSGHENQGFETETDCGADGIVPVDEIDNHHPRNSFPWMDQLADTRL